MATILQKRLRFQGVVILDPYGERFDVFRRDLTEWLNKGLLKVQEERVVGLERAPEAFAGLLRGGNLGKVVVQVSDS